jgi:hypothetical protein
MMAGIRRRNAGRRDSIPRKPKRMVKGEVTVAPFAGERK